MTEPTDADRALADARRLLADTRQLSTELQAQTVAYYQALHAAYEDAWFATRDLLEADPDQAVELAHIKAELDEARNRARWVLSTARAITTARFGGDPVAVVTDTTPAKPKPGWTDVGWTDNTTVGRPVSSPSRSLTWPPVRRSLWGRLFGRWFR
jgi:hypothetical protein